MPSHSDVSSSTEATPMLSVVHVTRDQLVARLAAIKGATVVTITARTDTKAKAKDADKTPNPFPRPITKLSRVNGMVNFHYDAGVLRRLEKEGKSSDEFRPGSSWHEPVTIDGSLTPLCVHKDDRSKVYVRFMLVQRLGEPTYTDANGQTVDLVALAPFLPEKSSYANQGLDEPLVFLTYSIDNVVDLTVDKEKFVLS